VARTGFKHGFKSGCESLAAAVRAEIGLGTSEPLDPRALAAHLDIPVHPVSSISGNSSAAAAIDYVRTVDPSVLSAMTIFPGWPRRHRVIIFNDANPPQRQNSDVAHELSHGLCLHEPRHAIVQGCRDYSKTEEDEAAWLSGCLLVPRAAAFAVAMSGTPIERAAEEYGVSTRMMSWRVNATGAKAQATRIRDGSLTGECGEAGGLAAGSVVGWRPVSSGGDAGATGPVTDTGTLGGQAFETAWAYGRSIAGRRAVEYALNTGQTSTPGRDPSKPGSA